MSDILYISQGPFCEQWSFHTILFQPIWRMYSSSTNAVNYLFNLHSSSLFRANDIIAFTADFVPIAGALKVIFRPWPDTMTSWAITWDQALFCCCCCCCCFFASLAQHKGIIGRGHDLRLAEPKTFLLLQFSFSDGSNDWKKSELILILVWFCFIDCIFTKRQNIRFTGKDLAVCSKVRAAWPVNMTGLAGQDSILAGHYHFTAAIILSPE